MSLQQALARAAKLLSSAPYLLITAGAGMGADSGLPVFRGLQGFWTYYKPFRNRFNFTDCASPSFLQKDPQLFWGFYGHRLNLYRKTEPHQGFKLLLDYINKTNKKYFVVTSNVDGHFQKAGFPQSKVYEIHGTINHTQCDSCLKVQPAPEYLPVTQTTIKCQKIPQCQTCKVPLRPNILMFGDWSYQDDLQQEKAQNFQSFRKVSLGEICVMEIGAGSTVPTIRNISRHIGGGDRLIRINPDDGEIKMGGLEGIRNILKRV